MAATAEQHQEQQAWWLISPAIPAEVGVELDKPYPAVCCLFKCVLGEVSHVAAGRYLGLLRTGERLLSCGDAQAYNKQCGDNQALVHCCCWVRPARRREGSMQCAFLR